MTIRIVYKTIYSPGICKRDRIRSRLRTLRVDNGCNAAGGNKAA